MTVSYSIISIAPLPIAQAVALRRSRPRFWQPGRPATSRALAEAFAALEARKAPFAEDDVVSVQVSALSPPRSPSRRGGGSTGAHIFGDASRALVAPGGTGSRSSPPSKRWRWHGRKLLHHRAIKPRRVLYWNLEDPIDEIERRFAAIAQHFGVKPEDYEAACSSRAATRRPSRSPPPTAPVSSSTTPALAKLKRTIVAREIDVVIIDPIVSAHGVPENDNNAIDAVIKAFAAVAAQTDCAILLVHHARKSLAGQARELEADDARGAAAFVDGCRIVRLAQRMTRKTPKSSASRMGSAGATSASSTARSTTPHPPKTSEWVELVERLPRQWRRRRSGRRQHRGAGRVDAAGLTEGLPEGHHHRSRPRPVARSIAPTSAPTAWFGRAIAPICGIDPSDRAARSGSSS